MLKFDIVIVFVLTVAYLSPSAPAGPTGPAEYVTSWDIGSYVNTCDDSAFRIGLT